MSSVIVFGAGGRAGRAAVVEAVGRGHRVTAVVRDVLRHEAPTRDDVRLVVGDVTDPASVAALARGHDAAVSAVHDPAAEPAAFFTTTAQALLDGLSEAGVGRLIVVGLASVLATGSGAALMDTPGYPQDFRAFYLAHAAAARVLADASTGVDWLIVSPAGDFAPGAGRTGEYRTAHASAGSRISHADLAVAMLDEIDRPRHHRTHLGFEAAAS